MTYMQLKWSVSVNWKKTYTQDSKETRMYNQKMYDHLHKNGMYMHSENAFGL